MSDSIVEIEISPPHPRVLPQVFRAVYPLEGSAEAVIPTAPIAEQMSANMAKLLRRFNNDIDQVRKYEREKQAAKREKQRSQSVGARSINVEDHVEVEAPSEAPSERAREREEDHVEVEEAHVEEAHIEDDVEDDAEDDAEDELSPVKAPTLVPLCGKRPRDEEQVTITVFKFPRDMVTPEFLASFLRNL